MFIPKACHEQRGILVHNFGISVIQMKSRKKLELIIDGLFLRNLDLTLVGIYLYVLFRKPLTFYC